MAGHPVTPRAQGGARSRLGPRLVWGVFFAALVAGAVVFGSHQIKLVVVHGLIKDEAAMAAFDAGLMAGMQGRPGVELRSLRVSAKAESTAESVTDSCAGIWYALDSLVPTLLIVVGEPARVCVDDARSDLAPGVPRVLVGLGAKAGAAIDARRAYLPHRFPGPTWSEALLSQRGAGRPYRLLFLAADSALARQQQAQFAALALDGVSVSTLLVHNWSEWSAAASRAGAGADGQRQDLLVIGGYRDLAALPAALRDPAATVRATRALFGRDIAATEVHAVGVEGGAAWAIEAEAGSIGRRAADLGLMLLGDLPPPAAAAQTISIALDAEAARRGQGLPPLFEAVARHQGLYR